jgi:Fic family protein
MDDLGVGGASPPPVAQSPPALDVFPSDERLVHAYAVFLANTHLATRYAHWDDVRFERPPADLSPEEWWHAIKLGRAPLYRRLALVDRAGLPFVYTAPDEAARLLHLVERRCSRDLPGDAQARRHSLVEAQTEEAIRTSQLADAVTPRSDAKALLRSDREPASPDERMVANAYRALRLVREGMDDELTPSAVVELQWLLTEGTGARSGFGAPDLPRRLSSLCDFANGRDGSEGFVHPVLRAILLHFWLAYDRPFERGNGRTGRALFYWSMRAQGYGLADHLSISRILDSASSQYARSFLLTETDDRDTTYVVLHQLQVLERAIGELDDRLARTEREARDAAAVAGAGDLNRRQLALIGDAVAHPDRTYTFVSHARSHDVTHETARQDLLALQERGLLARRKLGRRFAFVAGPGLARRAVAG